MEQLFTLLQVVVVVPLLGLQLFPRLVVVA
jgi:hypothetical protein